MARRLLQGSATGGILEGPVAAPLTRTRKQRRHQSKKVAPHCTTGLAPCSRTSLCYTWYKILLDIGICSPEFCEAVDFAMGGVYCSRPNSSALTLCLGGLRMSVVARQIDKYSTVFSVMFIKFIRETRIDGMVLNFSTLARVRRILA